MKNIGSTLLILGVGTIVLNLVGMEFRILAWIDIWGEGVGWAIRGAFIVAGAGLLFMGQRAEGAAPAVAPARQEPSMGAPPAEPAADPMQPPEDK